MGKKASSLPTTSEDVEYHIEKMLWCIERIKAYVWMRGKRSVLEDQMCVDAITYKLEMIGEAASRIPTERREAFPDIPWQMLVELRDSLIENYRDIDLDFVWDVVKNKLPEIENALRHR